MSLLLHFNPCYHEVMKKKKRSKKQVRIAIPFYDLIRREAFRAHVPMTRLLEGLIATLKK
jgi:hypothetical protein